LKEFLVYLDQDELIDLSSVSIRLRNKLKSKIFKCLKLERYPLPADTIDEISDQLSALNLAEDGDRNNNNEVMTTDSTENINSQLGLLSLNDTENIKERLDIVQDAPIDSNEENSNVLTTDYIETKIQNFKKDLTQFNSYPTELNVFGYISYYYIEEMALHFNSVHHIDLTLISVPFDILTKLFNIFNSIRAFKFNNDQAHIDENLVLPCSLKKLNWEDNLIYTITDFEGDPIDFDYYSADQDTLNDEALELNPQSLPKLEHLTYNSFDFNSQVINQFLELNPQIKSIDCTYYGPLLSTLISLLNAFTIINKLKMEFYLCTPEDFPTFTFPTLRFGIIYKICVNCRNLTNLSTIYYMTNMGLFNNLLDNLPELKVLTLTNELNTNWELKLNNHNNLECLNLKNFKKSNINFNLFNEFNKLKVITFTVEGADFTKNEWTESYLSSFTKWKFIHFRDCIKCYKLT
ncbi:hypothetical protein CONCODRAFT_80020, partial [Conidiobolus coronatus NRRL 28638]